MKKRALISILVIVLVVLLAIILLNQKKPETPEEIAQCIGKNSVLYIQLGCHACESQEELFGDSYQYLTIIDCFYEHDKCLAAEVTGTPTWVIKGEKYIGTRTIQKLQELTGC